MGSLTEGLLVQMEALDDAEKALKQINNMEENNLPYGSRIGCILEKLIMINAELTRAEERLVEKLTKLTGVSPDDPRTMEENTIPLKCNVEANLGTIDHIENEVGLIEKRMDGIRKQLYHFERI